MIRIAIEGYEASVSTDAFLDVCLLACEYYEHSPPYDQYMEKVRYLIEKGADINLMDDNGQTPIYYAIVRNNQELFDKLIEHPSLDVCIQDNNGDTPLHIANKNNMCYSTILDPLKKRMSSTDFLLENNDGVKADKA